MIAASIDATLQGLLDSAPSVILGSRDRLVVFSDLHMGDGSVRDDFRPNADLLWRALRDYYLPGGFALALNGDIEELQRFQLSAVRARWDSLYRVFHEFAGRTALYKIVGNHDERLWMAPGEDGVPLRSAVRFTFDGDTIFLFHGHQATIFFEKFNWLAEVLIRYGANALRISNYPVVYESRKRYVTEHRVYAFSSSRRILSVIGHTHRPLFESLSKIDTLKFRIERLCRDYPTASPRARPVIETAVASYKAELERLWEKDPADGLRDSLYDSRLCIPCLFNSGCGIGKRGITAIEIAGGMITLVHWFDSTRSSRHLSARTGAAERLGGSSLYRTVLKQDQLAYIFSRIRLLAQGAPVPGASCGRPRRST